MRFLQDKQNQRHLAVVAGICVLAILLCLLFCVWQRRRVEALLQLREAQLATALLEQGVPTASLAAALQSTAVSAAGTTLLQKAGHTGSAAAVLPQLRAFGAASLGMALAGTLAAAALLLAETVRELIERERIFENARAVVERFAVGDFACHLPRGGEGALLRLFAAVDALATALQAKGENERRARENLKDAVADISHQLKTPLAALSMYNEILADAAEDPAAVRCFTEKTARSIARMQQLILSLLKVLRLETGSVVFAAQPCPAAELARRAAQELLTRAGAENKQLCFCGGSAVLRCDPQWTAEALGNLMKNALDHTLPGGHVCVYWQSTPVMERLCVWDDGEGIAPEEIHFIFKRFYRSPSSTDSQGAGLGLPMAKAIVERQGGVLGVESSPGAGTTFSIAFPREPESL